jgi:hypothetical protein
MNTTKYIANRRHTVKLPWEPGLLEWLRQQYPRSDYREYEIVTTNKENQ